MYEEDIERIFMDDCRDKKRTGNGVHHRALRLRKHEHVRTPSERLKGFENRFVTSPGAIKITTLKEIFIMNIFDDISKGVIPTPDEIDIISMEQGFEVAQKVMAELLRCHTGGELRKSMPKMHNYPAFQSFCDKYEVAKDRTSTVYVGQAAVAYIEENRVRGQKPKGLKNLDSTKILRDKEQIPQLPQIPQPTVPDPFIAELMTVPIQSPFLYQKRKYKADKLVSFLERLSLFLAEDVEYEIEITLNEVESE